MTDAVLIDVNIPMYAAGRDHPLREPARQVVRAIARGELEAVTDAEIFQEILYRYLHIGERDKGLQVFDRFHRVMEGRVLPVGDAEVLQARTLAERHPRLGARDLIHLAVMRNNQIRRIVSADQHFDDLDGIERVDPTAFL